MSLCVRVRVCIAVARVVEPHIICPRQTLADTSPKVLKPGYVPPEALFCWTESDFASYINSGGFVKPKLKCQYYLSPENPQTIVDLLEPILSELNWTCTVDSHSGREESLAQAISKLCS